MAMHGKIISTNMNYKADYKECIDFLHLVDQMKTLMCKGMKVRIKALESMQDNKLSGEKIAKESKRYISVNKKIDHMFKRISSMAFGNYSMIYLFIGIYNLNVTQKITEGKKQLNLYLTKKKNNNLNQVFFPYI